MFKKSGLRTQLMLIFGGVFVVAIAIMTVVLTAILGTRAARVQEEALENNLYGLGYYMAYNVYGEDVLALDESGDFSEFDAMLEELSWAYEIDPNIERVYTVIPDGSGFRVVTLHVFLTDSEGNSAGSELIEDAYGETYASPDPELDLAWMSTAITDESEIVFFADDLGYDEEVGADFIAAVAPLTDESGDTVGLIVMESYADDIFFASTDVILINGVAALLLIPVLLGVVAFVSGRISAPLRTLEEAVLTLEDEERDYDPTIVEPLKGRADEVGKLARMFDKMAKEVEQREKTLKKQVQALTIEIDTVKRQEEVESITSTEFFQDLKAKAESMRKGAEVDGEEEEE